MKCLLMSNDEMSVEILHSKRMTIVKMLKLGIEPKTFALLARRSNQLSYSSTKRSRNDTYNKMVFPSLPHAMENEERHHHRHRHHHRSHSHHHRSSSQRHDSVSSRKDTETCVQTNERNKNEITTVEPDTLM